MIFVPYALAQQKILLKSLIIYLIRRWLTKQPISASQARFGADAMYHGEIENTGPCYLFLAMSRGKRKE